MGTSGTQAITVDKTAPVITLTRANGQNRTFPLTITATVTSVGGSTCGRASGDLPTITITVTGGSGSHNGSLNCPASGAWNFTFTSPLSVTGTYVVTATQADAAGNIGTSGPKTINEN